MWNCSRAPLFPIDLSLMDKEVAGSYVLAVITEKRKGWVEDGFAREITERGHLSFISPPFPITIE